MNQRFLVIIAVCLALVCSATVAMKPSDPRVVYEHRSITLPELPEVASCESVALVIPEMPEEIPQPREREVPQEIPQPNNNCCPAPNYHYNYHNGCRWEYTPGQPVRNIARFFHNRQPVRNFFRTTGP